MALLEERFRIPGGSLDLDDSDDGQVVQTSYQPDPSPTQIQFLTISHLNATELSRVLSCILHPLAARTAEYTRALNLSGAAFRMLDQSALTILAGHDPDMAEELSHIKNGVLPPSIRIDPSSELSSASSVLDDKFSPSSASPSRSASKQTEGLSVTTEQDRQSLPTSDGQHRITSVAGIDTELPSDDGRSGLKAPAEVDESGASAPFALVKDTPPPENANVADHEKTSGPQSSQAPSTAGEGFSSEAPPELRTITSPDASPTGFPSSAILPPAASKDIDPTADGGSGKAQVSSSAPTNLPLAIEDPPSAGLPASQAPSSAPSDNAGPTADANDIPVNVSPPVNPVEASEINGGAETSPPSTSSPPLTRLASDNAGLCAAATGPPYPDGSPANPRIGADGEAQTGEEEPDTGTDREPARTGAGGAGADVDEDSVASTDRDAPTSREEPTTRLDTELGTASATGVDGEGRKDPPANATAVTSSSPLPSPPPPPPPALILDNVEEPQSGSANVFPTNSHPDPPRTNDIDTSLASAPPPSGMGVSTSADAQASSESQATSPSHSDEVEVPHAKTSQPLVAAQAPANAQATTQNGNAAAGDQDQARGNSERKDAAEIPQPTDSPSGTKAESKTSASTPIPASESMHPGADGVGLTSPIDNVVAASIDSGSLAEGPLSSSSTESRSDTAGATSSQLPASESGTAAGSPDALGVSADGESPGARAQSDCDDITGAPSDSAPYTTAPLVEPRYAGRSPSSHDENVTASEMKSTMHKTDRVDRGLSGDHLPSGVQADLAERATDTSTLIPTLSASFDGSMARASGTPSAPSSIPIPDHLGQNGFPKSDLLPFSPFLGFGAEFSGEDTAIFKESMSALGADILSVGNPGGESGIALETSGQMKPAVIPHGSSAGSFPHSSASSHDATLATDLGHLGGEDRRPHDQNTSPQDRHSQLNQLSEKPASDPALRDADCSRTPEEIAENRAPSSLVAWNSHDRSRIVDEFSLEPDPAAFPQSSGASDPSNHRSGDNFETALIGEKDELLANQCRRRLHPPLLKLTIPISPTTLQDELSYMSPLFSPIGSSLSYERTESAVETPAVEQTIGGPSFSVSPAMAKAFVKLKRGARNRRLKVPLTASESSLASNERIRIFADASVQTDQNFEDENLRRRAKALERELRSLRASVRRSEEQTRASEEHVRESKPRSFLAKLATTERVVPPREPVFGMLKDRTRKLSSPDTGVSYGALRRIHT